jgi:hypothetical protein
MLSVDKRYNILSETGNKQQLFVAEPVSGSSRTQSILPQKSNE